MTIEELASTHLNIQRHRSLTLSDLPRNITQYVEFGKRVVEQCAQIAERNHWKCNCSTCKRSKRIASEIRALVGERK